MEVKSDIVWVVHGTIDTVPCLMFFPTRKGAMQYLIDVRNSPSVDNLAVMVVEGVDHAAVSVAETLVLGWVQDLILP